MTLSRFITRTAVLGGFALLASAPAAHAQFFDYSVVFRNSGGTPVTTVLSTDTVSQLAITNAINTTGLFAGNNGTNTNLLTFITTSASTSTSPSVGTFNFPYQISVTLQPADSNGVVIAGTTPQTKTLTGTLGGNLTQQLDNLTNTYDNIVNTPGSDPFGGPGEVLNFSFSDGSNFQVRALSTGFSAGSPPGTTGGSGLFDARVLGNTALAGTPEPGTWALFVGMGVSGSMIARRRLRRK